MSKLTITCTEFTPLVRNTLRGFATIVISELKLEIRDVAVHEKNGERWAHLPAKPMLDHNGVALRDGANGKIKYADVFTFVDKATREAFSKAVINAVLRAFPNAFATAVNLPQTLYPPI